MARRITLLCIAALLGGCVTISPFGAGSSELHETTVQGEGNAKILWLPISGFISASAGQRAFGLISRQSTLARVTQALDKAEKDDDIKALVLRIDSPGGTVAASDAIYARIKRYHKDTQVPVIASMGGITASGGYYIAMAADTVIAEPTTITGSIGVIIEDVNITDLLGKLGVKNQTYTSGPHKDILSPLRPPTADEHAIVQQVIDSLYTQFVQVIEDSRGNKLDRRHLDEIIDGRIFAAPLARKRGLIDSIGRIDDVLAEARREAGIEKARVIRYYQGRSAPASIVAAAETGSRPSRATAAMDTTGQPLYFWHPGMAH